jgi:sugar/nucleoside kinase (ribokinase family)
MKNRYIAVIGGANIEYIVKSDQDIIQGSKNYVDIEELYGGSGLNYSLRLMAMGELVFPILYIGNDNIGHNVQQHIIKYCKSGSLPDAFVRDSSFFINNIETLKSIIMVEGEHRTILAQDHNEKNLFFNYLKKQVKQLPDVQSVVIGHIHNDRELINSDSSTLSSLYAINYFRDLNKFIYCNFGASQINYGFKFWKDSLKNINILQLNMYEAKKLFNVDGHTYALIEIINLLSDLGILGIITLDKFGAVGFTKRDRNKIFMARPVDLGDSFVDSTGAGDAFCASMVSSLNGNQLFSEQEFKDAMAFARSSAMYACKFYGGANHCPTREKIDNYHKKINKENEVLEYSGDSMFDILSLIDFKIENYT